MPRLSFLEKAFIRGQQGLTASGWVLFLLRSRPPVPIGDGDGDGDGEAGRQKEGELEASRAYPTGSTAGFTGAHIAGVFVVLG